ncbi:MAG: ABC transporter substrate-binding protein [Methanosarcinaceae archaeon]|nr:ABC transporter substrate-binding protein [Methanosarcinaceae archaeon]
MAQVKINPHSVDRAKRFDFNQTTVLSNWAVVDSRRNSEIESFADLNGKKIAFMKGDIPVIFCTGFTAKMDEKKARVMGIRAFAFKPILKREIAAAIRNVLDE